MHEIGRRALLKTMLLVPPALTGLCRPCGAAAPGRPLMLVCEGIDAGIDAARLRAFLDPLMARRLKLGIAVGGGAALADPCTRFDPDLVEWIVDHPTIANQAAYFQMRQASAAQQQFAALRSACGDRWNESLTLMCRAPATTTPALGGIRAAGFRNALIRPDADAAIDARETANGVLQVTGGLRATLSTLDRVVDLLFSQGDARDPVLVYLALDELTSLAEHAVRAMADGFAAVVAAGIRDGTIAAMLPSDFHLAQTAATRVVALRFKAAGDGGGLAEMLLKAGIPFSFSDGTVSAQPAACSFIHAAPSGDDRRRLQAAVARALAGGGFAAPRVCAVAGSADPDLLRAIAEAGTAVVVSATSESVGLDNAGLLHVPTRGTEIAVLDQGLNRLRDAVVEIQANDADTFSGLARHGGSRMVRLQDFAHEVMPAEPIFALLKRTQAQDFVDSTEPAAVDADERARLLEDAALAWRYFTRLTGRRGIVPGTAQLAGGDPITDPIVTMWDIGSQALAIAAARSIGLIAADEFSTRIRRLLASIPATRLGDLTLPQATVSSAQAARRDRNFNASDTARLLVALKILATRFDMEAEVARIVERWDLAQVAIDGRLHHVADGRLKEYPASNYVDYATRGFGLWGFAARSPYAVDTGETGTDREMRLLYRVAELGPIATEPHVLEELEIGYSDASRLIARLLFTAQLGAYQASGRFTCVSEAPLDRDPWFSYQGFQLGVEGDPWTVATTADTARYQTAAFRTGIALVNTKAAFAWAAAHPHPYAQALLDYVRARAPIPGFGFASGIYTKTGKPTRNYSDCNTNAVVLEAIAYILNGRRPALTA